MHRLGAYVVSLTAASILCGILLALFQEGEVKRYLRLVCGVFLTVTALAPLSGMKFPHLLEFPENYLEAGKTAAAMGGALAAEEKNQLIKQMLEAYILNKAGEMGVSIQPEIMLDEDGIPKQIRLTGTLSGQERQRMQEWIAEEVGIPGEDQQWCS